MGFGNRRPSREENGKRDNRGKLWNNDRKRDGKDPDFTGVCTVDGRDYRVSAWNSDRDDTVSLSFRPKTEERRQQYESQRDYQAPPPRGRDDGPPPSAYEDFDR